MTILLRRLMVTLHIIENFSFGLEVSLHWVGYYVIKYFKAVLLLFLLHASPCESFFCALLKRHFLQ